MSEKRIPVPVDPEEPAWQFLRNLQRERTIVLLEWQDHPFNRDITLRQVSGGEVEYTRTKLKEWREEATNVERHRIALLLIREIDALDCDGKDKKAFKVLDAVLEQIKHGDDEAQTISG